MDRDEIARQGKQIASDLRDTVSQKVSENEDTIKGTLGKAARWVDEKTGGKYSDHIGKAESKVGDGIGWVASQGPVDAGVGRPGCPRRQRGRPGSRLGRAGDERPRIDPARAGAQRADRRTHAGDTPPGTAPGPRPPGPIAPDEGDDAASPAGLMGELAKATSTEPTGEPGRRSALLDEQWRIGPKMHGGYLLAVLAQAAVDEVPTAPGARLPGGRHRHVPACARPRTGRRAPSTCCAGAGAPRRSGSASTRTTGRASRPRSSSAPIPAPASPRRRHLTGARSRRRPSSSAPGVPSRPTTAAAACRSWRSSTPGSTRRSLGLPAGRPSGEGRISGWAELDTREAWSPVGLMVALDVLPPASFDLGLYGWSPTMSLTAHVHAAPAPGSAARRPVGGPPRGRAHARDLPGLGHRRAGWSGRPPSSRRSAAEPAGPYSVVPSARIRRNPV